MQPAVSRTLDQAEQTPGKFVTAEMHDLIFVSMEDWDDIWRRNQFLCVGLARRHRTQQILFVGLPRDYTYGIRTADFRCFTQPASWKVPDYPNITVFHPAKLFPNTYALGRKLNDALFRLQVKKAADALGLQRPLLWLNPHSAVHMVGKMDECAVIYDITDDWTALTQKPWLAALIREQDRALCQIADAVIVCSEHLWQLKQSLTNSLHLVPNGVDAAHYESVSHPSQPLPPEAADWRRPVLGYTGSIHPDRVDLGLVEKLAQQLPLATIVMIGPLMIDAAARRKLEALGNVILTGPKPYAQIPDFMRAFDVCITPHLVTAFTESLNPIKLWEYLAVGKPIISTPVAGFRDYADLTYLASTAEEFSSQLQCALKENAIIGQQRRAEARTHSWDQQIDRIESIFSRVLV